MPVIRIESETIAEAYVRVARRVNEIEHYPFFKSPHFSGALARKLNDEHGRLLDQIMLNGMTGEAMGRLHIKREIVVFDRFRFSIPRMSRLKELPPSGSFDI